MRQGRSEVLARHGIVATSDPLAVQAGLEILRQGGNAIDAAVAAGAVLDVTSRNDTGIGGDLFALVWVARDEKLYALNSAGWAPMGWTPEFFRDELGLDRMSLNGVNAATVPGAVSGYDALLQRFGTLTFRETFAHEKQVSCEKRCQRHGPCNTIWNAAEPPSKEAQRVFSRAECYTGLHVTLHQ